MSLHKKIDIADAERPREGGIAGTTNHHAQEPSFLGFVRETLTENVAWHVHSVTEVAEKLRSDPARGLAELEASRRLAEFGPNRLAESHGRTAFAILRASSKT